MIDKRTSHYSKKYDELDGPIAGVWVLDLVDLDKEGNPNYQYFSPGFWTTLGVLPETKTTSPLEWRHLIHPDDLVRAMKAFDLHLEDPIANPYRLLVRYKHSDDSWVWVICSGKVKFKDGKPVSMLGIHTDATELVLKEKAKSTGPLSESGQAMLEIAERLLGLAEDTK